MRRSGLFKNLPCPDRLRQNPAVRLFGRHLQHHGLWQLNRRSVAGGLAVGLFWGLIIPFAQSPLAALCAILMRVHLPTAVFATFVTNPFTTVPIYLCAYAVGDAIRSLAGLAPEAGAPVLPVMPDAGGDWLSWLSHMWDWAQSAGSSLLIGVLLMSVAASLLGYVVCNIVWRIHTMRRWRARRRLPAC